MIAALARPPVVARLLLSEGVHVHLACAKHVAVSQHLLDPVVPFALVSSFARRVVEPDRHLSLRLPSPSLPRSCLSSASSCAAVRLLRARLRLHANVEVQVWAPAWYVALTWCHVCGS